MLRLSPILLLFLVCSSWQKRPEVLPIIQGIIPAPVQIKLGEGYVQWTKSVTVVANTEIEKKNASLLQAFFSSKNIQTNITSSSSDKNKITFTEIEGPSLGKKDERYVLNANAKGIAIQANSGAGLFYGIQSFLQLISSDGKNFPFVEITDYPRFEYRGLHLDVGRHMFPPEFIKKYIDLMAHHKYNRFHWHLTEDQGWRIEIKKYPKLQEVAAFRSETLVGHSGPTNNSYDGKRYGGFYTQEEVKEIVKYAADRYITVVPEIEMPGHSLAALAAYPTLGCTGGPYEVGKKWGVFPDVYCAGKEETFTFLQDVLDEVLLLFPSQYIHIGGDECPKVRWQACPLCQARIKNEKLKDEHELQSYFIQRIEKYLNSKGRQIIGWDEILEGGLAPNATVMSWRGEKGGITAAKENHNVVMTPGNWCYFDHYQDSAKREPLAIGGLTPVSEVYSYEPVPKDLTPEEQKYILGAQGNVWTEYMATTDYVEYMVYPRACALAEVLWTPVQNKNYEDFLKRMGPHVKRLDDWRVNYAKHIVKDVERANSKASK